MKLEITIIYAGQELKFEGVEFSPSEIELHGGDVRETVVEDFYANFSLNIVEPLSGMEF